MKHKAYYVLVSVLALTVGLNSGNSVQAQSNITQSIKSHPSATDIVLSRGESVTKSLTVANRGSASQEIIFYAAPYGVEGKQYTPVFTTEQDTVNPAKWVTITEDTYTVEPSKVTYVPYTVTVPETAAPGGYYAVVFTETQPNDSTGIDARGRIGNILYITVKGAAKTSFSANAVTNLQVMVGVAPQVVTDIENTGQVHFLSKTKVSATSVWGGNKIETELDRYVLPGTTRQIAVTLPANSEPGLYKVHRQVTVEGKTKDLEEQWIVLLSRKSLLIGSAITVVAVALVVGVLKPHRKRK